MDDFRLGLGQVFLTSIKDIAEGLVGLVQAMRNLRRALPILVFPDLSGLSVVQCVICGYVFPAYTWGDGIRFNISYHGYFHGFCLTCIAVHFPDNGQAIRERYAIHRALTGMGYLEEGDDEWFRRRLGQICLEYALDREIDELICSEIPNS